MARLTPSLPFGSAGVDWQERVNFVRMREERLHKARAAMKKHGLAACVLTRHDNIRYTTGTRGASFMPALRYAVVFLEHDSIVYEHAAIGEHQKIHAPWIKPENWRVAYSWLAGICGPEAIYEEAQKFAKAIKNDLQERGLEKEKLGYDFLDGAARQALQEAGIEIAEATTVLTEARYTKTVDEINCLKIATSIADTGFQAIYEELKIGCRERDLAAVGLEAVYRNGAESTIGIAVKSGPSGFHDYRGGSTTDRMLQAGDLVDMDICGVSYAGYLTCYYRTFIVGRKPTAKQKDWYKRCRERIYAVIDAIKPGATTADAAKHFLPASTWGYKEEESLLCTEIGHGIGLFLYEMPVINRLWSLGHPQVFEKGVTMAIEACEGEPFVGGARLEEQIVVTDTGAEVITRYPIDEIIVPTHSLVV